MASNGWQQYDLRGSARTLRSTTSHFGNGQTQTREHSYEAVFLPDGRVSETRNHNPDGSTQKSTVHYDHHGRPIETVFESEHQPMTRHINAYDEQGRLVRNFSQRADESEHTWSVFHYHPDGTKTEDFTPDLTSLPSGGEFQCGIEGGHGKIGGAGARQFHKVWDNQA